MKIKTLLKGFSALNIILLLLGGVILGVSIKEGKMFQMLKPSHDYEYVLKNGLKEGDHIKGDIYFNYGSFATQSTYTQYETYRTADKTSGYYYIVPVGESGYAALYVRKDDKKLMDKMAEETFEYNEGGDNPQTVLSFNGVAVKMEKHLKGLDNEFKKYLKGQGYTDDNIKQIIEDTDGKLLVLEGPADPKIMFIIAGVGLALVALSIVLFIHRYKKEKTWEAKRENEWTQV